MSDEELKGRLKENMEIVEHLLRQIASLEEHFPDLLVLRAPFTRDADEPIIVGPPRE